MIRILGTEHTILLPQLYAAILLPVDGLFLLLQINGMAVAFDDLPFILTSTASGAKIVTTGLVIQLATLAAAGLLLASVLVRAAVSCRKYGYTTFHRDVSYVALTGRFRIFVVTVSSTVTALFRRLCSPIAEYAEGAFHEGGGPLATSDDEGLCVGLDGFLVAYALVALVECHPALFLRDGKFVGGGGGSGGASGIEAEPFVGADGAGAGVMRGGIHEAGLEELRKVYRAHVEERLSRFVR